MTVSVVFFVTPAYVAEIVTGVLAVTDCVLTANVALVAPAATVTLAGVVATDVWLLASATTAPPDGAAAVSVTVPVDELPPVTVDGHGHGAEAGRSRDARVYTHADPVEEEVARGRARHVDDAHAEAGVREVAGAPRPSPRVGRAAAGERGQRRRQLDGRRAGRGECSDGEGTATTAVGRRKLTETGDEVAPGASLCGTAQKGCGTSTPPPVRLRIGLLGVVWLSDNVAVTVTSVPPTVSLVESVKGRDPAKQASLALGT